MNQKGSALILALVLCLTVLPAAGQASWPDPDITLEIGVAEGDKDWIITLTARSGRATATCTQPIMKPQEEEDEPIPAG